MRIFFDNVNFSSNSGPNTFAYRLAENLNSRGHVITNTPDCDVHFAFIEQTQQKIPQSKLIQRLDGIWFKPDEFVSKNKNIKFTYDNADFVIWQTSFDHKMITKHWGTRDGDIIHNGIKLSNIEVTHQDLINLRKKYDLIFVSSANWHRQKRLKENIDLFNKISSRNNSSCMLIAGSNPDHIVRQDNIFYLGNLDKNLLMQIYAISDWMIHLAWLDHCPNTVIEALSQNVPIICSNSGGTKEIVKEFGIVLPEIDEYQFDLLDYSKPPPIKLDIGDLPSIKVNSSHININCVVDKYEKCFTDIIKGKDNS